LSPLGFCHNSGTNHALAKNLLGTCANFRGTSLKRIRES
jgi:hypothetical protein